MDAIGEQHTVAVETVAVRRDPRTGRFSRASTPDAATVAPDDQRQLGLTTRFAPGHSKSRTHGVYAFLARGPEALPDELRAHVDQFRTGLETDRGGASELTTIGAGYCDRLTEMEAIVNLLFAKMETDGLFTRRGRVRSALDAYLKAVAQWDRLASRIGLERRQKRVSLNDFLTSEGTDP